MSKNKTEKILLGSGKLYLMEFDGEVPELENITLPENLLGYIQGGATIEYKPTFYDVKDDLGYIVETYLTDEEASLKTGILTFDGTTLEKLCDTARVTEDVEKKLRIVKFGGVGNAKHAKYLICFHHEDKKKGDVWVIIVGSNQSGFSLAFTKDKETVIDAEFKALTQDEEGTLIQYIEKDESIGSEAEGDGTGDTDTGESTEPETEGDETGNTDTGENTEPEDPEETVG